MSSASQTIRFAATPTAVLILTMTLTPPRGGAARADTWSIDQASPTIGGQVADDLLMRGGPTVPPEDATGEDAGGAGPWVAFPGGLLPRHLIGFAPTLDADAISSNKGPFTLANPDEYYRIIFSVTCGSDGDVGTSVHEQFLLNQEGGDLHQSRRRFRSVGICDVINDGGPIGNDLYLNQTEMLLIPSIGPAEFWPFAFKDDLDAFDFDVFDPVAGVPGNDNVLDQRLYYSVSFQSDPDFGMYIFTLPAGWDAGDVPALPWVLAPVYADRFQLGLTSGDDIDALEVFDVGVEGVFDAGDAILLSLADGSTSLNPPFMYRNGTPECPFAPVGTSSDVFLVYKDAGGTPHLDRLALRDEIGWDGNNHGDLDALEVVVETATISFDINGDGTVGIGDLLILLGAWGGCPSPCPADFDGNGSVGIGDLLALLANWD